MSQLHLGLIVGILIFAGCFTYAIIGGLFCQWKFARYACGMDEDDMNFYGAAWPLLVFTMMFGVLVRGFAWAFFLPARMRAARAVPRATVVTRGRK